MSADEIAEHLVSAREKLVAPVRRPASSGRALGAAALAAFSGASLAAAVILGPGHEVKDVTPPTIFADR